MMKRILALLLVLFLLPVGALAEAFRLEVTISVDAENAAKIFKAAGLFTGASSEDELCRTLADFINGAALYITTQDDATRVEIAFDETSLLDLNLITSGGQQLLTSSLMEGTALNLQLDQLDIENDPFTRLLMDTDWFALLGGMAEAASRSLEGVEGATVRGSFTGDAYSGGVYCTTYIFEDKDVASLIGALMTEDFRNLLISACSYWDVDGAAILADADELNAKVAVENKHRYIVRLVSDAQMNPVGLSAVVLTGDDQLGTLSLGFESGIVRLVVGFGIENANYWHVQEIHYGLQPAEDGADSFIVSGRITEFTAPKEEDFSFAAATLSDLRMNTDWEVSLFSQGENLTWQYSVTSRMGRTAPLMKTAGQGLYLPGTRLVNNVTYSMDDVEYMTEKLIWAPCDPIDTATDGLKVISMTDDEAALEELGMTIGFGLVERLMKVLPMKLLMYFQ